MRRGKSMLPWLMYDYPEPANEERHGQVVGREFIPNRRHLSRTRQEKLERAVGDRLNAAAKRVMGSLRGRFDSVARIGV